MPLKLIKPRPGKTPYWTVRGTHLGQYVERSTKLTDRAKAAKLLAAWRDEIERGEFARPGDPTFLSAAVSYMKMGGETRYVRPLLDHFKERPLVQIGQREIDEAAFTLHPDTGPATRNRQVYSVVSAILKHAGIDFKLKRPKGAQGIQRNDWLWPEQAFKFFKIADEIDHEFGAFLRFLCYTGLRLGEAMDLQVSMVRLSEGFAYVPDTKNGDPRPVRLPPPVVAALANHPRGLDRTGKLFRFRRGGRLYNLMAEVRKKAGEEFERVKFHTFRHTWATWMRRYGGLDTAGLVATGAWRDRKSAARYEHVELTEEAMRADRLPTEKAG